MMIYSCSSGLLIVHHDGKVMMSDDDYLIYSCSSGSWILDHDSNGMMVNDDLFLLKWIVWHFSDDFFDDFSDKE